jgi:mannose-6-phosphate isomerase-like protein (cupin superfamily)
MNRTLLGALAIVAGLQAVTQSQTGTPPKVATDVTHAEVLTVLKMAQTDQQLRVVDIGKYNVGVGILHRVAAPASRAAAPTPPPGVAGLSHNQVTEVYYILSGSGVLVTGGAMIDPRTEAPDSATVRVLVGPSMSGRFKNGQSRKVGPGDIVIIPPGVPHGFSAIDDHVDYLSVRVDADHVLPAGYVHDALKTAAREPAR